MNALILAAGFGSRLMPLTQYRPKCMVECNGKKIIDYEIEALRKGGVDRVGVVGGYLFDKLKNYLSDKEIKDFYCNENYANTNMVNTFFCAIDFLQECIKDKQDLIVSYADIIYNSDIVKQLEQAEGDFCIVVDLDWKKLWKKRFDDPLSDAETLRVSEERVIELGKKPKGYDEIEGQYIGLFKFSYQFLEKVIQEYGAMDRGAMYDGCSFEKMYMTSFLQYLINHFDNARAIFIQGGWGEIDCKKDLEIMQNEKNIC